MQPTKTPPKFGGVEQVEALFLVEAEGVEPSSEDPASVRLRV